MKSEDVLRLRALSAKDESLVAITVRLSKAVLKEIDTLCAESADIKRSVVLRDCLERGWRSYEEGNDAEP